MKIVALVTDLADREALGRGVRERHGEAVTFIRRAEQLAGVDADLVVVDLTVPGALDAIPNGVRVLAYAPHVETELLEAAASRGAEALPRSIFFRRWVRS